MKKVKKVQIDDTTFEYVGRYLKTYIKGYRGLSSKKKRKHEKNVKKVIPYFIEAFLRLEKTNE